MKQKSILTEEYLLELAKKYGDNYTYGQIVQSIKKDILEKIEKEIDEFENPYPKDIFKWDNKEKLNFNRGRFNEFTYSIVENMR